MKEDDVGDLRKPPLPARMIPSIPLWVVGAVLIVVGPWVVNRVALVFAKKIEDRTDAAIAAMKPRGAPQAEPPETAQPSGVAEATRLDPPEQSKNDAS